MGSAKDHGGRRRFTVVRSQAVEAVPTMPAPSSAPRDLVLGGRRYRLIPLEVVDEAAQPMTDVLTARELQIVALVAQGRVNKQIADDLQISEWTVSTHLRRIFAKLGVDTRAAMVSRCLEALRPPADRRLTR